MQIDKQGNYIGRGEYAAMDMCAQLFPDKEIKIQVKFKDLLKGEWKDSVSGRQEKETIDIVIYSDPIIAVRIQDPHHTGRITSMRDTVQKKTLEWNDVKVVDVNHYDAPNLMKDLTTEESMKELLEAFNHAGIY
jgi:hypothetical protein